MRGGTNVKPLALNNARAIQLSPIEAFLLTLKGKRDGKIGLPRKDETGGWSSPQCSKEAKAYYEFTAKRWMQTEDENAKLHREIAAMERNISNKQKQLDQLKSQAPSAPDLSFTYLSEAEIDPAILQNRRQREHARANGRYFAKCNELRNYIEQAQDKISDCKATVAESENITRLICERAKHRTEQRISAYRYGLLCTNANTSVPVNPLKIAESNAEQVYFTHHRPNAMSAYEGGMAV
jgi:hypothetical protein